MRRVTMLVCACAVLAPSACTPPDRPPRLARPLPQAARLFLEPDSSRTVRVTPGIWYHDLWSPRGPWAVHLLELDLGRCELGFTVIRAGSEPGRSGGHARVSDLVSRLEERTIAAVNGDFFTPEGMPIGPEVTPGGVRSARARPALSWRPGARAPWIGEARPEGDSVLHVGWRLRLPAAGRAPVLEGGVVVGGFPEILDHGRRVGDLLVSENPRFAASRHPRTAVGYDVPGGRLWILVVDGRQGEYSQGMTLPELAELMEALGVREGLNLDGGGSSAMVIRGRVVNRPSDADGERAVVNALAVRRDVAFCRPRPL